jgi:hypothetical protein
MTIRFQLVVRFVTLTLMVCVFLIFLAVFGALVDIFDVVALIAPVGTIGGAVALIAGGGKGISRLCFGRGSICDEGVDWCVSSSF